MGGLQLHARVLANMALTHEEYLYLDDFDAVLDIFESDFLEYGDEYQLDMNLAVEKIPTNNNSSSYPSSFCAKVCLSKDGLTRHISTKYLETVILLRNSRTKHKSKGNFTPTHLL